MFSPNQIAELLEIINFHHTLFIFNHVGKDILTSEDRLLLLQHGIDVDQNNHIPTVNKAFKFGVLAEALGNKNTQNLSFNEFKQYIKEGRYIPLTKTEEFALDNVKKQKYKDIKNLSNKIGGDLSQVNIEIDKELKRQIIRDVATEVVQKRLGVKKMVSKLGYKLDDWNRDLGRVSDYVLHEAYEEGRASHLESKFPNNDPLVYKDVFTGGCKHCIRIYLTNGIGSEPRLFKLSTLRANGTNIGRKPIEWKAVIGPTHPYCRCTMQDYDRRYKWNHDSQSFSTLKLYTPEVQRRSKIHLSIGDKKFEV